MTPARGRATRARLAVDPGLRTSLVHLPASLCNTLLSRNVVAQTLLVELGTDTGTYYCGWTGLSAAHAVLDDPQGQPAERVVVGPLLASLFTPALRDGASVDIRLFRSPPVPVAEEVHVVPVHADDWEILSIHADDVEANMLAQVRAAKQGQVLAVQVGRSAATVVRFVVEKTVPPTNAVGEEGSGSVAVRLSTDTEVIVAPRQRAPVHEPAEALAPLEEPTAGPLDATKAAAALAPVLWRVLPSAFVEEPADPWLALLPASHGLPRADRPSYELAALAFRQGKMCLTRVPCPAGNSASDEQPANATASAAFAGGDAAPTARVPWPEAHVWLGKDLRDKLQVEEYDLVQISAPPPGAVRGSSAPAPTSVPLTMYTPPALPGMDTVLETCVEAAQTVHLQRILQAADQGRLDVFEGAGAHAAPYVSTSGVLLCGAPGSGKTSVAHAVGAYLASVPSLAYRTEYVDCGAFVEERMPSVRSHFREWLNKAAWHAPTLLILDNLDVLLPAEAENVDGTRARQLAQALAVRIQETVQDYDVFVLATVQSTSSVHPVIQNGRLWTEVVTIKPPAKDARRAVLQHLVHALAERAAAPPTERANPDATADLAAQPPAESDESATPEAPSEAASDTGAQTAEEAQGRAALEAAPSSPTSFTPDLDWVSLVSKSDGYHVADLKMLTERAVHQSAIRSLLQSPSDQHGSLRMEDFAAAQEGFTPLSLRDVKLEHSSTNWSDIGGLTETRQTLRETLEWPTKYAAIFASSPLRLRSGLLLYGYPGCGKTLLASAVAKECGLNFISVKGPEILNKYIGASEKSVRDLFDRAQAAKPCVLFFDEFDSIAPKRGHDSTGVTDRVVNQMLTQMDGAEGLDGVYVLAATSRPDLIDSALLRPGRLDKSLLCDMPSYEDRVDILHAIAQSIHVDETVDFAYWGKRTDGFSGADLQALLYNAHLETINAAIGPVDRTDTSKNVRAADVEYVAIRPTDAPPAKAQTGAERAAMSERLTRMMGSLGIDASAQEIAKETPTAAKVSHANLVSAIRTTRPSVPQAEVTRLTRIYHTFAGDRPGAFPSGEPSDAIGARTSLM